MIPIIDKTWIKQQIDEVREAIGRTVTFYTVSGTACSICVASGYYDPVNNTSYYIVCPICKGNYWVNTSVPNEILARIHWVNDEAITATPGGKYYVGEATVTIDEKYLTIAEQCQTESGKVLVDSHDMQISRIIPFGAPEISRYRVVLRNMGDRPAT